MKKILIITPRSPFQDRGADEQDRFAGVKWFLKRGFEVRVITKTMSGDLAAVAEVSKRLNIKIVPVSYKFGKRNIKTVVKRLLHIKYWDGAAYEYFDPEMQSVVKQELHEFEPDVVWFDYTYLWPLYEMVKQSGAKIITRSINFEPWHFLDEDGHLPWNYVRALPKFFSEYLSFNKSNFFFAITPKERNIYVKFGSIPTETLPLRSLPSRVGKYRTVKNRDKVQIGFMPSTYTVHHNLEAVRFLVEDVLPLLSVAVKEKFELHITGNKFPEEMRRKLPPEVVYDGFVESSSNFWLDMDIALAPSLFGAGMQQKIFEPLTLGVPTITSKRGMAGYPFVDKISVMYAESKEEFAGILTALMESKILRQEVGMNAKKIAEDMFNQTEIDRLIELSLT